MRWHILKTRNFPWHMHFYSVSSDIAISRIQYYICIFLIPISFVFKKQRKHQKEKEKKYKSHRSPEFKSSRQTSDAQEFSFHPGFLSLCITRPCYQPFTFLYFYLFFTSLASWDNDQVNYPSIRQIGYCRSRPSVYPEPPPQITLGDLQDNRYVVADLCGTTGSDSTGSLLYYNDLALPLVWMGNDHPGIQ